MNIQVISFPGKIGNIDANKKIMIEKIKAAKKEKVDLLVFPAFALTTTEAKDLLNDPELQTEQTLSIMEIEQLVRNDLTIIFSAWVNNEEKPICLGKLSRKPQVLLGDDFNKTLNEVLSWRDPGDEEQIIVWVAQEKMILNDLNKRKRECETLGTLIDGTFIYCSSQIQTSGPYLYTDYKYIKTPEKIQEGYTDLIEIKDNFDKYPYIPKDISENEFYQDIIDNQAIALYNKMQNMHRSKICIGVSGGLDSTVSLLTCYHAFKKFGLDTKNIIGITMPGFGTTERSLNSALDLMESLDITSKTIDLKELLSLHLKNLEQPENIFDLTYEQTQSRERTQVLLDIANKEHAIMIGTGCMSEFALGWMTYGGDHLSMYAINIGLPKTLVKCLGRYYAKYYQDEKLGSIINTIVNAPVSPELLPVDTKGEQHEKTEEIIGDYAILDFIIYHFIQQKRDLNGILELTLNTFIDVPVDAVIHCFNVFFERFLSRQYKKNCYGDGIHLLDYSVAPERFKISSDIDYSFYADRWDNIKKKFEVKSK